MLQRVLRCAGLVVFATSLAIVVSVDFLGRCVWHASAYYWASTCQLCAVWRQNYQAKKAEKEKAEKEKTSKKKQLQPTARN